MVTGIDSIIKLTKYILKGLSYEIDFENVDKGRGLFLNFSEAPLIFG